MGLYGGAWELASLDKPGRPALPQWALWEPMGPGQPGQARPAGCAGDEGSRKVGMTTSWYQAIETQGYSHMATSRRSTKPGIGIALRLVRRKIGMALVKYMGGVWAKCALWPLLCRSKQVKQVSSRAAIQSSSPLLQMTISMIIDEDAKDEDAAYEKWLLAHNASSKKRKLESSVKRCPCCDDDALEGTLWDRLRP